MILHVGPDVSIHSLSDGTEHNGSRGQLLRFDLDKGRCDVAITVTVSLTTRDNVNRSHESTLFCMRYRHTPPFSSYDCLCRRFLYISVGALPRIVEHDYRAWRSEYACQT